MSRIFVAGHNGMVGSSILRNVSNSNVEIITKEKSELDLIRQSEVEHFFKLNSFDQVYLAAAKVGGIFANNAYPADFIYQNLMIQANIIHSAYKNHINKLLFLGSSCIYPKYAKQPIEESELLKGELEQTNIAYSIAKISGIKMCESYNKQFGTDYRCIMPTNLYGPGDNYHLENSHVVPALIRKFHEAKQDDLQSVTLWGTGKALREFLHVEDMSSASIFIMNLDKKTYDQITEPTLSHINVGSGDEFTIKELSEIISSIVGFKGKILWDKTKPDGTPRKLLNSDKLKSIGWQPKYNIEEGISNTYEAFLEEIS